MKAENVEEEFIRHLDRVEQVLSQSEWLVGENQTIADIAVVAQLGEVIRTSKKFGKEILIVHLWQNGIKTNRLRRLWHQQHQIKYEIVQLLLALGHHRASVLLSVIALQKRA